MKKKKKTHFTFVLFTTPMVLLLKLLKINQRIKNYPLRMPELSNHDLEILQKIKLEIRILRTQVHCSLDLKGQILESISNFQTLPYKVPTNTMGVLAQQVLVEYLFEPKLSRIELLAVTTNLGLQQNPILFIAKVFEFKEMVKDVKLELEVPIIGLLLLL